MSCIWSSAGKGTAESASYYSTTYRIYCTTFKLDLLADNWFSVCLQQGGWIHLLPLFHCIAIYNTGDIAGEKHEDATGIGIPTNQNPKYRLYFSRKQVISSLAHSDEDVQTTIKAISSVLSSLRG